MRNLLCELPAELLEDVIGRLDKKNLSQLNLTSRWGHLVATPQIWSDVELVDCRTYHDHEDGFDEHDDTKIIGKLLLLANNPWLASCVQTLTHKCHLPPPAIFGELPGNPFTSQTLSTDPRTIKLVQMAAMNMPRVHTLRIILGHPHLTDALLRCFFDAHRHGADGVVPLRKLWLENCNISAGLNIKLNGGGPYGLPSRLSFQGLESVRFRRLPMRSACANNAPLVGVVYSRGGKLHRMQDGLGGMYETTVQDIDFESDVGRDHAIWLSVSSMMDLFLHSKHATFFQELDNSSCRYEDENIIKQRKCSSIDERHCRTNRCLVHTETNDL